MRGSIAGLQQRPQLPLQHLARRILRQFLDEHVALRPLEARDLREAVRRFEAAGNKPVDLATTRATLARLELAQGDRAEARRLLDQALPVLRKAKMRRSWRLTDSTGSLWQRRLSTPTMRQSRVQPQAQLEH